MLAKIAALIRGNKFLFSVARSLHVSAIKFINASATCPLVYHCRDYTSSNIIRFLLQLVTAPFYMFRYFKKEHDAGRSDLALVLTAKNEAPYVAEWIDFHLKQGVSHFIIYNNDSSDNLHDVLKPYIDKGIVSYFEIHGQKRHIDVYNIATEKYKHKFKYMGFIDCDEFVFVRKPYREGDYNLCDFLDDFMSKHENAGGIAIHWVIFGSNGHETKPEGGVLENYTARSEDNYWRNVAIKTICDPLKVFAWCDPHSPLLRRGYYDFDEDGRAVMSGVSGVFSPICMDRIRINHYFSKSKEEYIQKRSRGSSMYGSPTFMSTFNDNDRNDITDTEILSRL